MMKFLEKTLQLEPKPKTPAPPKRPRFDLERKQVQNILNSDLQENIREMTRLRVANALRSRIANHNILTWNKKDQS